MKQIPLTQGQVAIIDDADFEKVSVYKWFARKGNNTFYASTWVGPWRERKLLHLHHLIAGVPADGMYVDHEDRNGLNNQRRNLRQSTISENSANRTPYGKSKYLGVSAMRRKNGLSWRAFIAHQGKNTYLGIFRSEREAAAKYNEAAIELHKEFANLNIL